MFFSKPGEYKACGLFSLQHIGLILATFACVTIALKKTVHKSKEEVYKIAEEYANTGIKYLDKIEKESSFDNYLKNFEKKALKELKKIEQENED